MDNPRSQEDAHKSLRPLLYTHLPFVDFIFAFFLLVPFQQIGIAKFQFQNIRMGLDIATIVRSIGFERFKGPHLISLIFC